ncbi:MAG: DUF2934 domain-containing protein [Nitrospirota bacterium]
MKNTEDLYDAVAKAAYDLYEKRGRAHGYHLEDWLEAEKIVMKKYAGEIGQKADVIAERKKKSSGGMKPKTSKIKTTTKTR